MKYYEVMTICCIACCEKRMQSIKKNSSMHKQSTSNDCYYNVSVYLYINTNTAYYCSRSGDVIGEETITQQKTEKRCNIQSQLE